MTKHCLMGAAISLLICLAIRTAISVSQPPPGGGRNGGDRNGPPPPFELGKVLPPFVEEQLNLTRDQRKAIADLEREVKARLEKILTQRQQRMIKQMGPPGGGGPNRGQGGMGGPNGSPGGQGGPGGGPGGPNRGPGDMDGPNGGPGGQGGPGGGPGGPNRGPRDGDRPDDEPPPRGRERSQLLSADALTNLVKNPRFTETGSNPKTPANYTLKGDVEWTVGGQRGEFAPRCIALHSGTDLNGDDSRSGLVSQDVTGFKGGLKKWFRFSVRGLAEDKFAVKNDDLSLKVDFYSAKGTNYLDGVLRKVYSLVKRDREDLAVNGDFHRKGGAVWKTYALEFSLPFAEIDQLRLTVGFQGGSATSRREDAFYVTDWELIPIDPPASAPKVVKSTGGYEPSLKRLVSLGGRWYYDPGSDNKDKPTPLTVNYTNATRLYYRDNHLTNPFAENMTAWLRKGYLDIDGNVVNEDRLVANNLVVRFEDDRTMIVRARNIPNHPTSQFPEPFGGNPSYIQEHDYTYYLPLNPVHNPKAVAMNKTNSNWGLPMGAIGIAINGVVFYNPFDAEMTDATNIMDRCCGHPSPDNRYHYHKYPVCVKSPFVDEGEDHSPLIGWAFDGFPIYGPYETKGVMAKDCKENPLNEFNGHYDEVRGWHYHVTPGKFPYIIGGYWGKTDSRNFPRRGRRDMPQG